MIEDKNRLIRAKDILTKMNISIYSAVLPLDYLHRLVAECQTIDAVEVVRCKNCKHRVKRKNWCKHEYWGCNIHDDGYEYDDDYFCGSGEKGRRMNNE